jgi:hypothetical protein
MQCSFLPRYEQRQPYGDSKKSARTSHQSSRLLTIVIINDDLVCLLRVGVLTIINILVVLSSLTLLFLWYHQSLITLF